jgi:hypothetical protein
VASERSKADGRSSPSPTLTTSLAGTETVVSGSTTRGGVTRSTPDLAKIDPVPGGGIEITPGLVEVPGAPSVPGHLGPRAVLDRRGGDQGIGEVRRYVGRQWLGSGVF